MTELAAVTIALEQVGVPPPLVLTGTLDSDVVDARRFVTTELRRILTPGWPCNTVKGLELPFPPHTIVASGGAGTFTYGQTVTESVTLAVFTFDHEADGKLHLHLVSGTPTGGQTLTGTGGGAPTRVGGTYALVTENAIAADPDWLQLSSRRGGPRVTVVDGFVQELDDDAPNTTTFDTTLTVDVTLTRAIDEVSDALADYVAAEAGYKLQKYLKRGNPDDQNARENRTLLRNAAIRERRRQTQFATTETPAARQFKGFRSRRT
jgi:hypothetical protein